MLRLLFDSLEQSLGPSLHRTSLIIYWTGLSVLAYTVLAPLYRMWVEQATVRTGLERLWIMTCPQCGERTMVLGRRCANCRGNLELPWTVRLWHASTMKRESAVGRWLRVSLHGLGLASFAMVSLLGLMLTGAFHPQGELHRTFLGGALLSWAAVGWLGGRVLHLGPGGLLGRVRDTVLALAALGVLALSLFLASMANPVPEFPVAEFTTEDNLVRVGDQALPITGGEVEFEYLELDHALLGYHRVIGLSLQSQGRLPIPRRNLARWLVRHLWDYADAYTARGLSVRRRTERFRVQSGHAYAVVQRGDKVTLRPVGGPSRGEGARENSKVRPGKALN